MNNEINLPPFKIGQRVVCVNDSNNSEVRKGSVYTVMECWCCKKCSKWQIGFAPLNGNENMTSCPCGHTESLSNNSRLALASRFAPVTENFQSIEYKEVLEKEKPLVCVN